jgi:hypothetical protein
VTSRESRLANAASQRRHRRRERHARTLLHTLEVSPLVVREAGRAGLLGERVDREAIEAACSSILEAWAFARSRGI